MLEAKLCQRRHKAGELGVESGCKKSSFCGRTSMLGFEIGGWPEAQPQHEETAQAISGQRDQPCVIEIIFVVFWEVGASLQRRKRPNRA